MDDTPDFIEEVPTYHINCGVLGGGMIPKNRGGPLGDGIEVFMVVPLFSFCQISARSQSSLGDF